MRSVSALHIFTDDSSQWLQIYYYLSIYGYLSRSCATPLYLALNKYYY